MSDIVRGVSVVVHIRCTVFWVQHYQNGNSYWHFGVKGKGKLVPVIFLTEHHAMKVYWGNISMHS
jgi:hypothetical protein